MDHMKARLNELSEHFEIHSSQQTTWKEYAGLIKMLAEKLVKEPNAAADATTISRCRAEIATEFSKKLARIAHATSKLQAVLTEAQQKILHLLNFELVILHFRQQMRD